MALLCSSIGPLVRRLKPEDGITPLFWRSEKEVDFLLVPIDGERL